LPKGLLAGKTYTGGFPREMERGPSPKQSARKQNGSALKKRGLLRRRQGCLEKYEEGCPQYHA